MFIILALTVGYEGVNDGPVEVAGVVELGLVEFFSVAETPQSLCFEFLFLFGVD
mgnify:CR=1 FL=1